MEIILSYMAVAINLVFLVFAAAIFTVIISSKRARIALAYRINAKDLYESAALSKGGYILLANYSNRDILIYLSDGYVKSQDNKVIAFKPDYYTLKANKITSIYMPVVSEVETGNKTRCTVSLVFKYKDILTGRILKIEDKK